MAPPARARILAALLLAAYAALGVRVISGNAPTYDEGHYFGTGRYLLKNFRWDIAGSASHPPLFFWLQGLPLLPIRMDDRVFDLTRAEVRADPEKAAWPEMARGPRLLLSTPDSTPAGLLARSRLALFAALLLLGALVFAWASRLGGEEAGLLALLAFAFSPNLLAHGTLATPDGLLACAFFGAVFAWWRFAQGPRVSRLLVAGLAAGLALLSKFPALLLVPLLPLLALLGWASRPREERRGFSFAVRFGGAGAALLLGFLLLWAGYGGTLAPYAVGLSFQGQQQKERFYRSYLFGELREGGFASYAAVCLLLKTPLPLLALALLGALRRGVPAADRAALLLPVAAFLGAFTVRHEVNAGIRYLLPAEPFLCVLAGLGGRFSEGVKGSRGGGGSSGRAAGIGAAALFCWLAFGTLAVLPSPIAFFNEIAGGPRGGWRYLADSNVDWGQDLFALGETARSHGIGHLYVSYYGTLSPAAALDAAPGRTAVPWTPLPGSPHPAPPEEAPAALPPRGFIAISVTNLLGLRTENPRYFAALQGLEPFAEAGHSIRIYAVFSRGGEK